MEFVCPKVLTRLAQADNVEIQVKVQATLKEGQTTEPVNTALKELGISQGFREDRKFVRGSTPIADREPTERTKDDEQLRCIP